MKVAILYICTGRYNQFFKGFYESCERNFLPNSNKEYFVWTDDDGLAEGRGNVYIYHKECAGFPVQSPNQKIPDRKTKCVIKTHINIKQNVIFSAKLKPV